ncbi:sugar ABC transporter substrate-binding protein [Paraburkholderia aspalathi]|nr:sugar ABC transporter substrate-binding protein [Paraburkholderia aspalathi]
MPFTHSKPSLRPFVFRLLAALLWLGGLGWSPTFAASGAVYKVNVSDVLQITVFGQPKEQAALSGLFPVGADGSIIYPIVGNIEVSGLTSQEIGQRVGAALAEHMPGLSVTAAVSQYAPVFVLGDIKAPGKYEYRPGMVVLELMALGGGAGKGEAPAVSAGMQMISTQQDYADLQIQIFSLDVKRARTDAELNNREFAFNPPASANPAERALHQKIIDGEKTLFTIRRNTLASEQRMLVAQADSYNDEMETLRQSIKLHDAEILLMEENVASNKSLVDRGLAAKSGLRELERGLSSTRRDALQLASYLARARQNQLGVQQRIAALTEVRQNEAATVLQDIDLNLIRMKRKSASLLETLGEVAKSSGNIATTDMARKVLYTIMRNSSEGYQQLAANERSEILAGDILRVEFDMRSLGEPRT